MKIVQVSYQYRPFPGGVSDAVTHLCSSLCKRGHEVIVYTCSKFGNQNLGVDRSEVIDGVIVKRILNLTRFQILYGVLPNPAAIFKDLKNENPDIVHLHGIGFLENDYVALVTKHRPLVLTGHGGGMYYRPDRPWYHWVGWSLYCKLLAAKTARRADRIVALTPYEIPFWLGLGAERDRINIIPWGIPSDCFIDHDGKKFKAEYKINGPMLLFVGALAPGKGAQWLIKAMPEITSEFPDAYAVFCGPDVGYKAQLVTLARKLGVSDRVIFTGFLPRSKLLQAYAACHVFVMPSDHEGFGLSIAQAMPFGKPVIASMVGAVPYIVEDSKSGLLIRQRDFTQLAKCAKLLLADSALRSRLGNNGRILSRKYDWNIVCEMYEQTYSHLLGAE